MDEQKKLRPLTRLHLEACSLPKKYWRASLSKVPDEAKYKEAVIRYIEKIDLMLSKGKGLLLWGVNRSGKTSIASVIVKEAIRKGYECHFIRAADLVDAKFHRGYEDEEMSAVEVARTVDLLVLDDLGKESSSASGVIEGIFDNVLRARDSNELATIVTTNLSLTDQKSVYKESMMALMRESMYPLNVQGYDFSKEQRQWLESELAGESE